MRMKIISICLVLCTLLGILAVGASAEEITPAQSSKIIYVSDEGDNKNGDGTSEDPYKTFETAYNAMLSTGGSIVIMDDVKAFDSHTDTQKILPECQGTVYVYGVCDTNGRYPTLDFSKTSLTGATVVNLGTSTVFYDLTLTNSGGNLWFAAAFHELTFGFNITTRMEDGCAVKVTGGYHADGVSANENSVKACNVNIYSGEFDECWLGNYSKKQESNHNDTVVEESVFNLYGGTVRNIYVARHDEYGKAAFNANAIINMYGGEVTEKIICQTDISKSHEVTLNLYNGAAPANLGDAFKYSSLGGIVNILSCRLTVPEYVLRYCGVQDSGVDGEEYSVRFVGTVSSLGFDEVGFEIDASNGESYDWPCKKVYTSIEGDGKTYTATELGGNYIFAVAIKEIPKIFGDVNFSVIPFIKKDGLTYYGKGQNVCYSNAKYADIEKNQAFTIASLNLLNNDADADKAGLSSCKLDARMPRIIKFIKDTVPDSIGVQECEPDMWSKIDSQISDSGYECIRDIDNTIYDTDGKSTFKNFIWYNSETTELVKSPKVKESFGQIWLSSEDDKGSPSKAASSEFYITAAWMVLRDKDTKTEYVHINTHLDSTSTELRENNLEVLKPLINEFIAAGYNVFVTGDFNEEHKSDIYKDVVSILDDTRTLADSTSTLPTYTKFGALNQVKDYCFCAVDNTVVNIDYLDVVEKFSDGENAADYMSDHSAVVVGVSIYTKK